MNRENKIHTIKRQQFSYAARCLFIIVLASLATCTLQAQRLPVVHHQCWDIAIAPQTDQIIVNRFTPSIAVDSGALLVAYGMQ